MNRQTKRAMARQGSDRPTRPERRPAPSGPQTERTGPRQYLSEVRGEMKKVAWPPRQEIMNTTVVVVIGLVVMVALIFAFDWASVHVIDYVFG
ncbi:MAG TPA: preprotein translocase subunit SecE [Acidimicrobiia bacterium]|jgi:preprotein translocase subunit SecE|nr:preprotein translocase subunit SecE [Acidimicrobiia bacterium]